MLESRRARSKHKKGTAAFLYPELTERGQEGAIVKTSAISRDSPQFRSTCVDLLVQGYPDPFSDIVSLLDRQDTNRGNGASSDPASGANEVATDSDNCPPIDDATLNFTADELRAADDEKRSGDLEGVTARMLRLGWDLFAQRGDLRTAVLMLERALGSARLCGSNEAELEVTSKLGGLCRRAGDYASAAALLERCAQVAEESGLARRRQQALSSLIELHTKLADEYTESDDLDAAVEHIRAALAAARGCGDRKEEAECLHSCARLTLRNGDIEEAADLARQYIALCESLKASKQEELEREMAVGGQSRESDEHLDVPDIGRGYACLAKACRLAGKDEEALSALAYYQKAAAESGDTKEQAAAKAVLGVELAKDAISGSRSATRDQVDAVRQLRSAFDLRRGLVEAGAGGVSRADIEGTRVYLGIAKAGMLEDKLIRALSSGGMQKVLDWKTSRNVGTLT